MNKINTRFGALVKGARKDLGLSQDALATEVGISRTAITNIESGRQGTTIEMLYKIAEALEVQPVDLLPKRAPLDPSFLVEHKSDAERINRLLNSTE